MLGLHYAMFRVTKAVFTTADTLYRRQDPLP
jgi:hypothetical protein